AFINGTEGIGRFGDMRFIKVERLLFSALTSCVAFDAPKDERNIGTIISMLEHMLPNEDEHRYYNSSNHRHSVDFLFERIEGQNPDSISAEMYQDFKYIAGTHAGMIVESWLQRLTPFRTEEMSNYFSNDELGLDHLGTGHSKRVALFISAGKSDYFNFLVPLLYSQLFDRLYANWTWR
ncbi:MAG: hypothetical protein FWE20_11395, partial [Defluviitaleaceae bacterium]|nr:hypothetical protein [Defluviitaleaceae bacterium]